MKVAIDVSSLHPLNQTRGIGIYAHQLVQALAKVDDQNTFILADNQSQLKGADIIHYPTFDLFFPSLPLLKRAKRVVTIHDVIPLVYPDKFKPGIKGKVNFKLQLRSLKQSDQIIVDSHATKQDVIKHLKISRQKLTMIYLGVSSSFRPTKSQAARKQISRSYQLNRPYLLYVGDVNYNKNVPALIQAFAKIKSQNLDLVMVSSAWSNRHLPEVKNILSQVMRLGLDDRVKLISKLESQGIADLVKLYSLAKVYIQPSLYEGFGLPVLEAMACGTPVVCSQAASLPEVAGQAAIMVKPTAKSLAAGLNRALSLSSSRRQTLVKKGLAQAKQFTWEKTARETIKVYHLVAQR